MGLFSSAAKLFSGGGGSGPLGSVLGPIGGIADTATNILMANSASSKAKREAERNRAWQTELSNTAHQRAVADLNAAGLNEILAANNAATTPGGGLAQVAQAAPSEIGTGIGKGMEYEIGKQNANSQTKIAESTEGLNATQSAKNIAETKAIPQRLRNETAITEAKIKNIELDNQYQEKTMDNRIFKQMAETEKEIAEGRISRDNAEFLNEYGITKEQALQLGESAIHEIFGLIREGVSILSIRKRTEELLKELKNKPKIVKPKAK